MGLKRVVSTLLFDRTFESGFGMGNSSSKDGHSEEDAQRRYEQALRGAFKTPPQPMDELPKKRGGVQPKRAPKAGK